MVFNCYAFTNEQERVIIDLGLPRHEAVRRCEAEADFLRDEFHLQIERSGDDWYEQPGYLPRVCLIDVAHDNFALDNRRVQWLPEG